MVSLQQVEHGKEKAKVSARQTVMVGLAVGNDVRAENNLVLKSKRLACDFAWTLLVSLK